MIDPILVAQALAIPITTPAWRAIDFDPGRGTLGQRDPFLLGGPGDDIERAARTLAVERWPLQGDAGCTRRCIDCTGTGAAPISGSDCRSCRGTGSIREEDEREDNDGGSLGCPPAAVRHVLAGCLVLELVSEGGFRYGSPPPLEDDAKLLRLPLCARRPYYDEDYPDAPHYAVAHRIMEFYLGMSTSRDPEAPCATSAIVTDAAGARRAVELAIRLLCDEETPIAEIVCDAAATLLHEAASVRGDNDRRDGILARARRMLRVVAPMTRKEVRSEHD